MDTQRVETKTEYFAKKSCVDKSIQFFSDNPDKFFLLFELTWNDEINNHYGEEDLLVRKEVLSTYLGVDISNHKEVDISRLFPKNKEQYLELYDCFKAQSPKDEKI